MASKLNLVAASSRNLIDAMDRLKAQGIDCSKCFGECCTSRSNSMQISAREAQTIKRYLEQAGLWGPDLWNRLQEVVRSFRLDYEVPSFGSRSNLRRTYTCPFYSAGPHGCSLPIDVKPLGCLAFNPVQPGATGLSSGCRSDQAALMAATGSAQLDASKSPIPLALLALSPHSSAHPGQP